ncbi:DUF3710 domain-containing protein [Kineococcus rubinsiae]|uniref:DUF3710 domain-containing protein n=1 Tax=Kineococcus rubinsiae TaxID=2609562 RepID=UPI001431B4CA|nr:DUF3710 domain-containing protein [Kineococcus rubinsiae]NIZ92116.1 DUF3710 domain-containing protein [Kineococcus rubinsiae]
MSLFRRRKSADDDTTPETAVPADGADETTDAPAASATTDDAPAEVAPAAPVAVDRSAGPFDASEVELPDGRLALGALRLAGREGMELRFEVEEGTQRVIAVTVGIDGSTVQLQVFAAPRTFGVWDEIRGEIATAVAAQGGTADEVPGTFGAELLCRLPVRTEDGRTAHQPTRFAGVDGPRWFLRAVFAGHAAHDAAAAAPLEEVVRGVVVVRGEDAMAPRELLPLALPEMAQAPQEAPADAAEGAGRDDLDPFERGPEITEVR